MTDAKGKASAEELDRRVHEWWETTVLDATGEYVWDDEVKAINAMMTDIDQWPQWALQVRGAMPKYGFEMCSHRWLDGLDDVIRMIGAEEFHPSGAGHCGDVPGRIVNAAGQRAAAVECWIHGKAPAENGLHRQVAGRPESREKGSGHVLCGAGSSFFL